jgi:hypothetical protein
LEISRRINGSIAPAKRIKEIQPINKLIVTAMIIQKNSKAKILKLVLKKNEQYKMG